MRPSASCAAQLDAHQRAAGGGGLPRRDDRGGAEAGRGPRRRPGAGLVGPARDGAGPGLQQGDLAAAQLEARALAGLEVGVAAPRREVDLGRRALPGRGLLGGARHGGEGGGQQQGKGEDRETSEHRSTITRKVPHVSGVTSPAGGRARRSRRIGPLALDLPGDPEAPRHRDARDPRLRPAHPGPGRHLRVWADRAVGAARRARALGGQLRRAPPLARRHRPRGRLHPQRHRHRRQDPRQGPPSRACTGTPSPPR